MMRLVIYLETELRKFSLLVTSKKIIFNYDFSFNFTFIIDQRITLIKNFLSQWILKWIYLEYDETFEMNFL